MAPSGADDLSSHTAALSGPTNGVAGDCTRLPDGSHASRASQIALFLSSSFLSSSLLPFTVLFSSKFLSLLSLSELYPYLASVIILFLYRTLLLKYSLILRKSITYLLFTGFDTESRRHSGGMNDELR